MNYEMGEPCELPNAVRCSKLEPNGQWFRWHGPDGGWRVGKAIMLVDGRYLMHDVAGHWLVDTHDVELHPSRDDWERETERLSPIGIEPVYQHRHACINDPSGRVTALGGDSFFDAPENFEECYLIDFGDGVKLVAMVDHLAALIGDAGLTSFVNAYGLMGLTYEVIGSAIVGVSVGDDA